MGPRPTPRFRVLGQACAARLLLPFALAGMLVSAPAPAAAQAGHAVVYLVRHAEPAMDGSDDPGLNDAGLERAHDLALLLSDDPIARIFTTDFNRTRQTVRPLADRVDADVELYDPRTLQDFATHIRSLGGRSVVAGHSNTTPDLVRLLGGTPGPPINEAYEFDRLYVLVLAPSGETTTLRLRYGSVSGR